MMMIIDDDDVCVRERGGEVRDAEMREWRKRAGDGDGC